ncbi:sialate O-acetylesterase [Maribacter sp. 2307ULW6-5]|uniref:sialate O-acetylesterase n=1 Tax=Maribacter sp. 2307ULW6-5 TaxID=3386275 RepID=UPI0039BD6309
MLFKSYPISFLLLLFLFPMAVLAEISLPAIFSDDMVLQRESKVLLYGWANPNEKVLITTGWDQREYELKTGTDAKWSLEVQTPGAGGPYTLGFKGGANAIVLENVMIGEVWLCSGQSNMEWSARNGIDHATEEIEQANYPQIRLFTVAKRSAPYPQEDVHGQWAVCSPDTMANFSAVAYFFARKVQAETGMAIGLIDAAWGATSAEVWTPEAVFLAHPKLAAQQKRIKPNPWVTTERSRLYNAMIAPLRPFAIAGVLWYQGESNTANGETYAELFTQMIRAWRKEWGHDFPFYYAQIAPYKYNRPEEGAVVRDQQRRVLAAVPNTGMVVTSDIGNVEDIHPQNKQDVGLRLARLALKRHYGMEVGEVNGPLYKGLENTGKGLTVHFDHAEGLHFKNGGEAAFEVAGEDGVFHPAKARIKDDAVLLRSKKVPRPVHVRFAWANVVLAQLFNAAGLPASTFTSQ